MAGFDDYMNTYIDRRMKDIVQEWNLGTMRDFGDYQDRLNLVETEIRVMSRFTHEADTSLTDMEQRLEKIREKKQ